jgi:hypothetical protein
MSQACRHPASYMCKSLKTVKCLLDPDPGGQVLGWRFSCVCHLAPPPVFVPVRMGRGAQTGDILQYKTYSSSTCTADTASCTVKSRQNSICCASGKKWACGTRLALISECRCRNKAVGHRGQNSDAGLTFSRHSGIYL